MLLHTHLYTNLIFSLLYNTIHNHTQRRDNMGNILTDKEMQIVKDETIVITLEMVRAELNESDDINVIKSEIASDLLVAKIGLDFEKTGKVNKEQIKKYIDELF